MKSLNTKKIMALAAGAALLGGALLGAGSVTFGNTELVNANGNVVAKVVVGENAGATDGVAAANIAAVLGNRAFKQTEVSATPTGLDGLTCEVSSDNAQGTCEVLSKSVTLEIVTPAGSVPAGAYAFETLIEDPIDADLQDRSSDSSADEVDSPWNDNDYAYKIDGGDFPSLASYVVTDSQSGDSFTEDQAIYVKADGRVKYSPDDDSLAVRGMKLAYEVEFDTPGLPVCQDSKSGHWAYCIFSDYEDDNKKTENHRVHIKFLGEDWIISDMNPPDIGSSSGGADGNGGSIKLAKESAYSPKLQIGESLDLGDGYKLTLGDLKPASGNQGSDYAIFSVYDADGNEVANEMIAAGDTTEIVTSDGHTYRVRVYQAAPGYTLTEKWAEVAVFADELELKDGDNIDDDDNNDWDVTLQWYNEDTNSLDTTYNDIADHLWKIQLINENVNDGDDMLEGDSETIIADPAVWKFTFTGLTLDERKDYSTITLDVNTGSKMFYAQDSDADLDDANKRYTGQSDDEGEAYIRIRASDKIFRVRDQSGTQKTTDELIFSPFGYYNTSNADFSKNVLIFKADDGKYYWTDFEDGNTRYGATYTNVSGVFRADNPEGLEYKAGDKWYTMGIWMGNVTDSATDDTAAWNGANGSFIANQLDVVHVIFGEDADNGQYDWVDFRFEETGDGSDNSQDMELDADYKAGTDEDEKVWYRKYDTNSTYNYATLAGSSDYSQVEAPYLTHRGSWIRSISDDGAKFYVAKEVGKAQFMLQAIQGDTSSDGSTTSVTLHEGEETTLSDGVVIRVTSIDCETGACSAGSGSATVAGVDGVSCELNVPASNLGVRQDVPADLVVLDSQAAGLETVIAVGGPAVNTVTQTILEGTTAELNAPGDTIVQEVETGRIVVAGYTAEDTLAAAQQFISSLVTS